MKLRWDEGVLDMHGVLCVQALLLVLNLDEGVLLLGIRTVISVI